VLFVHGIFLAQSLTVVVNYTPKNDDKKCVPVIIFSDVEKCFEIKRQRWRRNLRNGIFRRNEISSAIFTVYEKCDKAKTCIFGAEGSFKLMLPPVG
jgi:hypothetical protein